MASILVEAAACSAILAEHDAFAVEDEAAAALVGC
jgi:hypothetical protein